VAEHPEIRDVPIERPVFILGFPRTGTTLLHNLLAQDPAARPPALRRPVPPGYLRRLNFSIRSPSRARPSPWRRRYSR